MPLNTICANASNGVNGIITTIMGAQSQVNLISDGPLTKKSRCKFVKKLNNCEQKNVKKYF